MEKCPGDFLQILEERGFLYQCTHKKELQEYFAQPRKMYIGFDATANSLHVGSLLPLMVLRWAKECGHHPILLLGGGTTQVGDPSEKDATRKMLQEDTIDSFAEGIRESIGQVLPLGEISVLNNKEWLPHLKYLPFLREFGALFSVNAMLSFESVKRRLDRDQPLSFLEFNYMVCQAYDFYVLAKEQECLVQAGGSDQWGNIVSGIDLIRRKLSKQAFGFTVPLLQNSKGEKMGKTAQGAVWLSKEKLNPYDYWQYWRNVMDEDIERFLKLFTMLSLEEISRVTQNENPNDAKKILADEATGLLHGPEVLQEIRKMVVQLEQSSEPFIVDGVDEKGNLKVTSELPVFQQSISSLEEPQSLIDVIHAVRPDMSKGSLRRMVRDGGLRLNGDKILDELFMITRDVVGRGLLHVRCGKKQHILIQFVYS